MAPVLLSRQPAQHGAEVGVGVLTVEPRRLNQTYDGGGTLATAQ